MGLADGRIRLLSSEGAVSASCAGGRLGSALSVVSSASARTGCPQNRGCVSSEEGDGEARKQPLCFPGSPVWAVMGRPSSPMKSQAIRPSTPAVSSAMGTRL